MRKWLLVPVGLALAGTAALVPACYKRDRGYFAPRFTPDGRAVVAVVRDSRAVVTGLGYEMFTPPARVYVARDRFSIVRIGLDDRRIDVLRTFPASPTEGTWIQTYRPRYYGQGSGHLRWTPDGELEHEIGVTVAKVPLSETFLVRRRWNNLTRTWDESAPWAQGTTAMGGDEPSQLHGNREVAAVRAGGAMPCAIVVVTKGQPMASPLAESSECRAAHPDGYPVAGLIDVLRRAEIERVEHLRLTHERLVAEARARGLSEGDAALDAIDGMQRLGLYPKPSTLVVSPVERSQVGTPLVAISAEEFRVGLFSDIRKALDRPGEEVGKDTSPYIVHREFDTSRQINAFLDGRTDTVFFLEADASFWRVAVDYR
jgi:hypothetical protein